MVERLAGRPEITVDDAVLGTQLAHALVRTVVDASAQLPDMVVLQFRDVDRDLAARAGLRFGSRVEVRAKAPGNGATPRLIVAEITAMEQETDSSGTWTVLRGYDLSHRLARGRHTRTFTDTTDADMVRQLARGAGLPTGEIDDDGTVHEHVSQANLTDWDFLRCRAYETGHRITCAEGKLTWRRPAHSAEAPPDADSDIFAPGGPSQLLLGRELLRFRPRVTAAEQVSEVQVRGWDPQHKRAVVGSARTDTASAAVGIGPGALAAMFGGGVHVVVDRPISSQDEADVVAASVAAQIAATHAEAEATALGDPRLVPGSAVRIGGVGWPHDGSYVLSSARHIWDDTGYHTEFTVSGAQERSLLGLSTAGATTGSHRAGGPLMAGLVVGQVTDIDDPDRQFRVKVGFPWLADDYQSWWCRVAVPGAGKSRGMAFLPEVGDEVLVGFAHGDTRMPFVVGGLFNGVDTPPLATDLIDATAGQVRTRALVSRHGHRLVFGDDDSRSQVLISSGDGSVSITLDSTGTAIVLDSSGTVTVRGATGLRMSSDADISVQAGGSLTLSGAQGVRVDGGPSVAVVADEIRLN